MVPVTTVPAPLAANTRSTQSRGRPRSAARGAEASMSSRATRSSARPRPERESTASTSVGRNEAAASRCSSISSRASSRRSSSTRSAFVITARPCEMPSRSRIRRCSSLCGIHPSVAATTRIAASTAPTPASMFLRNRTCPGTSTNPSCCPDGSLVKANPRSMVRPRVFSSGQRSGSVPVRARTSDDLPWSTCPAVATTRICPSCGVPGAVMSAPGPRRPGPRPGGGRRWGGPSGGRRRRRRPPAGPRRRGTAGWPGRRRRPPRRGTPPSTGS